VAACAHQHLVVSKALAGGQTTSDIREVQLDDRVREVARMLGGSITDTSRAHAQAMLETAHQHSLQHAAASADAADSGHANSKGKRRKEAA
jgi:DNA repair protein RecN (Recombination protein N)